MDRVTAQSRAGVETSSLSLFGLKVFMDARRLVTPKEGDRYPLGPPSYLWVDESVKSSLLVGQKGSKDLGGSIPLSGAQFCKCQQEKVTLL